MVKIKSDTFKKNEKWKVKKIHTKETQRGNKKRNNQIMRWERLTLVLVNSSIINPPNNVGTTLFFKRNLTLSIIIINNVIDVLAWCEPKKWLLILLLLLIIIIRASWLLWHEWRKDHFSNFNSKINLIILIIIRIMHYYDLFINKPPIIFYLFLISAMIPINDIF